jgi:hypothetical protein
MVQIVRSGLSSQQVFENALVNLRQLFEFFDIHMFVDFVDRLVDRPKFQHLGAGGCDKAAIRGAARGFQRSRLPRVFLYGLLRGEDQFALRGQEGIVS